MTSATARVVGFYALHLVYLPALIGLLHLLTHGYALLGLEAYPRLTGAMTLLLCAALYVGMGYGTARLVRRRFGDVEVQRIADPGQ